MQIKKLAFFAITLTTIFTGCEDKGDISKEVMLSNTTTKKQEAPKAPTFNLTTSNGKPMQIIAKKEGWEFTGLKNKAVLVDFFGTWCPPCKAEIPHLNNIREKTKNEFEIIGIDIGKRGSGEANSIEHLEEFIMQYEIKYPITTAGDNNQLFGAVSNLNTQGSIPFMILFDKNGKYFTHYIGMVPEEMLQNDIDKVLGK